MRSRALLLALLATGCVGTPEAPTRALTFGGTACTEVGLALEGDLEAARALLPEGFRAVEARESDPRATANRSLVLVAVNHCTFRAVSAGARELEAFAWVAVEPPDDMKLVNATEHAFEAGHWRPRGAMLQLQERLMPDVEAATLRGQGEEGFGDDEPFDLTVEPESGGMLQVSGIAAAPTRSRVPESEPCCRTLARGVAGLVAVDFSATEQRYGEAQCALRTTLPGLTALLGANHAGGRCTHNAPYNFTASARPLP